MAVATAALAQRPTAQRMRRVFAAIFAASGISVVLNFVSGMISARVLGPEGRGALAAVQILPNVSAWIFGMGAMQAVSYYFAKRERDRSAILGTWFAMMIPASFIALAFDFTVIPHFLSKQTDNTQTLAMLWAPTVFLAIYSSVISGALVGLHRYKEYASFSLIPAFCMTCGMAALWLFDVLSVGTALLTTLVGSVLNIAASFHTVYKYVKPGAPNKAMMKATLPYGVKAHGSNFSQALNGRLDLLIMPSILGAASVGKYAVATNLSWIIVQISAAIYPVVTPAAVGAQDARRHVLQALKASMAIALMLGVAGAVIAGIGVRLIYGIDFTQSATVLRILIPGAVLYAGAQVLWAGLYAANKPLVTFLCQLPGLLITAVGLLLFLNRFGIVGAAYVSTIAYSTIFFVSLFAFWKYGNEAVVNVERTP